MLLKDFNIPGIDEKKLFEAYNSATRDKGQFLLIDSIKGELRKNFDQKFN